MPFAIFASLAMHIGLVLILSTATAMSTGLKLLEDPVLHVSLVSIPGVTEIREENPRPGYTSKMSEPVTAAVSIDNREKGKIPAEEVAPRAAETRSLQATASTTSSVAGSGFRETTTSAQNDTAHRVLVASNVPAMEKFSLAVPRYRDNTHHVYPRIARLRGYEGVVLLSAEIFADGNVGHLRIKKSSGYAVLDRSALDAVKIWKFEPGRKMGKPISMWVDVPVKYILKNNETAM
jgi:protein TonB